MRPRYTLGKLRDSNDASDQVICGNRRVSKPPPWPELRSMVEYNRHFIHPRGGTDFTAQYPPRPVTPLRLETAWCLRNNSEQVVRLLQQNPSRRTSMLKQLRALRRVEEEVRILSNPPHPNSITVYV